MTSQDDFLRKLVGILDASSVPYMICGSFASSFHGQPRATRDVDIVVAPTEKQLLDLVESLGGDYYVSLAAVREAFANQSMFNIIDNQSGWKADLVVRKDRPFSRQEFKRRCLIKMKGLDLWVTSPEDIILSKLEWARDSGSQQQFRDALGVALVQWGGLDLDYLRKWAKELNVEDSLQRLLEQAEELEKGER
jgi:hypothetical protein